MDSHPTLLAPAPPGVAVLGPPIAGSERVLTPQALAFVADLERRFGGRRRQLLARRKGVQMRLDAGERPVFADETRELRQADWKIAEAPHDLRDRRVEIT